MTEYELQQPYPGMSVDEYAELWNDLMLIDRTCEPEVLGEVLAALLPGDAARESRPCPFKEGSEAYNNYCASQYAAMIGARDQPRPRPWRPSIPTIEELCAMAEEEAEEEIDQLQPQAVRRERIVRPRRREE
jgi:hypothetical protein